MTRRTTGTTLLDGLSRDRTRHGKVRWFYREGDVRVQLRGIHDEPPLRLTEAVMQEYEAARDKVRGRPIGPRPGTLSWLIDRFLTECMAGKHKLTLADARSALIPIRSSHGHRRFAGMSGKHVAAIRDEAGGNPGNKRVKYLKQMFAWAIEQDIADANPARDVKKIRMSSEGYKAWTREDIQRYETFHPIGTKARLAFALLLYTGQRISDVSQFGPINDRSGRLVYVQHKGKSQRVKRRSIPIAPPLRSILDATPLGETMWLETEYGKPFSIKGLGQWFKKRCIEAGMNPALSAHGVRKATGVIAAERGCTAHQIMEILGHDTLEEAERYTRQADAMRLADDGFAKTFGGEE